VLKVQFADGRCVIVNLAY